MSNLIQVKKLSFATIEFYKTFIICKMKEGIVLDISKTIELHEQSRAFYNGLKYGFIFDRTVDFTIDPIVYMKCPYYPDISALHIVADNISTKKVIHFEQNFTKYPIKLFSTIDEAISAMNEVSFGEKSTFSKKEEAINPRQNKLRSKA